MIFVTSYDYTKKNSRDDLIRTKLSEVRSALGRLILTALPSTTLVVPRIEHLRSHRVSPQNFPDNLMLNLENLYFNKVPPGTLSNKELEVLTRSVLGVQSALTLDKPSRNYSSSLVHELN
ncbi:MAG: hypothetical protein NZO16_02975 [Deltaproteobacteria bacterium]|nr:hypothetical protein [Deltaproteobacteria bacterium]